MSEMKEIISDRCFKDGFELHHVDKLVTDKPIAIFNLCGTAKKYPSWQIAQWCSKHNLANGTQRVKQNGYYEIADNSKKVTVNTDNGEITLSLDASDEYTFARREGEGWPHLLIEQDFPYKPKVMSAKKIILTIEMSINKVVCLQKEPINENLHTAQFSWIFAIADKSEGKGKDDYIWFGCPIYDFRYPMPKKFQAKDEGSKPETTGKYMYFVDSKNYLEKPVKIGERFKLSFDVSDLMKEGILDAKSKHYLPNSNIEDLVLNNTNLGWEIPGTFDAELTFYNLSVQVEE